jgi:hypothetical protein
VALADVASQIASAKRGRSPVASWYSYYAGYPEHYVADVLIALDLPPGSVVMDPWSGSGTTARVAAEKGYTTWSYDLNPALTVVAKARLASASVQASLPSMVRDVLEHAHSSTIQLDASDPLLAWFDSQSAQHLRGIERSIARLLVDADSGSGRVNENGMSSLAALFYVALFSEVHTQLRPFRTTNPTWIKSAKRPSELLRVSAASLDARFTASLAGVASRLGETRDWAAAYFATADAATTMPNKRVEAVISSPPYCTRIDYVVATLPELAVLNLSTTEIKQLRESMMGSPRIPRTARDIEDIDFGPTASGFLNNVRRHTSKASGTYYTRFFANYFSAVRSSLTNLARSTQPRGTMVLVVQDSYYKELRLDLAQAFLEMAGLAGWSETLRSDLDTRVSKAAVNPRARVYRDSFDATESAILCRK